MSAVIFAITDEGHAEINHLCNGGAMAHEDREKWPVMPLDYLRRIGNCSFPLLTEEPSEINAVAVLEAAGMVQATVPACRAGQTPGHAIVLRITPLGQTALVRRRAAGPYRP